jgi:hypothetical protein
LPFPLPGRPSWNEATIQHFQDSIVKQTSHNFPIFIDNVPL